MACYIVTVLFFFTFTLSVAPVDDDVVHGRRQGLREVAVYAELVAEVTLVVVLREIKHDRDVGTGGGVVGRAGAVGPQVGPGPGESAGRRVRLGVRAPRGAELELHRRASGLGTLPEYGVRSDAVRIRRVVHG